MCKVSTPKYEAPPEYARAAEPDNSALQAEATARAAGRGGARRSTILTGLKGSMAKPNLAQAYGTTVLG